MLHVMLHVTHYMCDVGIRLRCGATCKSKFVCVSAALFSLCPQHTHTHTHCGCCCCWCKRGFYFNAIISSIISSPCFFLHHFRFHFFFFLSKYLFSSQPQQNSKHSPLLFTSLTTTGMLLFLKVRSHFWVLQKFHLFASRSDGSVRFILQLCVI